MSLHRHISTLALVCGLLAVSMPSSLSAETVVRLGGSGTGSGAMRIVAQAFEKGHPGIKVRIMPSLGSSGGIKALLGGGLDIALSARPLKDEEKRQGATAVFSGRTAFILLTHTAVPQTGLSSQQLEEILTGRQQTWSDGSRIKLVLRPSGDTDTQIIRAISPGISQAMQAALARPGMRIALTDQDAAKDIARTPGALGFSTIAQFSSEQLQANILAFNGRMPSLTTLTDRSYPLTKDVIAVAVPARITPAAQQFISFVTSPQGLKILEKQGIMATAKTSGH